MGIEEKPATLTHAEPVASIHFPNHDDWLSKEELAALTPAILINRVRALKPLIAAHAREAELQRRPVDVVWNALRKTGVFYHFVPKRYGGLEFDLQTFIEYVIIVSEACASTGWVLGQCVEHNWGLAAYPVAAQDDIFGRFPYIVAPGVHAPPGKAIRTEGGYRVTGRWEWASGIMNSDWVKANVLEPQENGPPRSLQVMFPSSEATVLDTWNIDGMCGTGSNDVAVHDIFVPIHRVLDVPKWVAGQSEGSLSHANPIYRIPMLTFLSLTTMIPAVGAARSALAHFKSKQAGRVVAGGTTKRSEQPATQMRIAKAEVLIDSAERIVRDVCRQIMSVALSENVGEFLPRAKIRAENNYAMEQCREAVRIIGEGAGAGAHCLDDPIQRAVRDINVMASHALYDWDATSELYGRALLGLEPNSPRW